MTGLGARRPRIGGLVPLVVAALLAVLSACQEQEFEPPDRGAQVAAADSAYAPALFDSIAWPSDSVRALQGNIVYAAKCRQCHGPLGGGDTPYARQRELEVPSLVLPDWEYAGDLEGARRRVFIGHEEGMPTWGVAGITPREIDAAVHYLLDVLRPELLGPGGGE